MSASPEWQAAVTRMMRNADLSNFQPRPMPTGLVPAMQSAWTGLGSEAASSLAGLRRFIPGNYGGQGQLPPGWWMAQQPVAAREAPQPTTAVAPPATTGGTNDWGDIEREAALRENITNQLGDFSRKVLNSKWFGTAK